MFIILYNSRFSVCLHAYNIYATHRNLNIFSVTSVRMTYKIVSG